jgi:hypothetical protein
MFVMTDNNGSQRTRIESCLISGILILITIIMVMILFPYDRYLQRNQDSDFVQSLDDFEKSEFCRKYDCYLVGHINIDRGINNAYQIRNYPVYNEFFIEVITRNNKIIYFGISLDPKVVGDDELQLIEMFLTAFSIDVDLPPDIMVFVEQNLNNRVSQICNSRSIEFGSRHLWVGNIGGAPSLLVSESCSR